MPSPEQQKNPAGLLIVSAIVTLAAFGTHWLLGVASDQAAGGRSIRKVVPGGDYYVSVPLVEVSASPGSDMAWDSFDDSAPDPYVEIYWRTKMVFQSSTKSDTFIASWSNAAIDLKDLAKSMGETSIDEVIRAARITVQPGEVISFLVYDNDPFGKDDLIGEVKIPVEELIVGDDTRAFDGSLRRIVIRTRDMSETPDLFK